MTSAKNFTVLVVEDEWLLREESTGWFRDSGWTVLETALGAQALATLQNEKLIHLLYTDITLADTITGWDVAATGLESHPDLAVIYASGGPDDQTRRRPESIFLPKPVSQQDLMLACSRLLPVAR